MPPHEIRSLVGTLLICLLGQALLAEDEPQDARKQSLPETSRTGEAKPPPDYEALIDSLANRKNRAPLLLKEIKNTVPVFFEPFDAAEENRVCGVAVALIHYPGNELWPHLNAHSNDQRYALTSSLISTEDKHHQSVIAINETVGDVCNSITWKIMDYPCKKHLKGTGKEGKQAREIPEFPHPTEMKTWGKKGKTGRLDEVQIEICQFVLDNPSRVTGLSDKEREKCLEGVRQELEQLQRTGVALMPERINFRHYQISPRAIDSYREKYSELARQQLEQEKQKLEQEKQKEKP